MGDFSLVLGILHVCGHAHVSPDMDESFIFASHNIALLGKELVALL